MALDPQIPLAAAQPQSFAKQMGETYQLAGAIEKQQEYQQQKQDQQAIQAYLKEGGNFNTPDGLAAAAEKLKGIVSPNAYQTLTQAQSEMKTNAVKQEEAYAKMQPELIDGQMKQMDFIAQNLQGALSVYDEAKAQKGEPAALQDFEAAKQKIIQNVSQQTMPGGKPLVNPQMLQQFQGMNPKQAQSALMGTKYQQERLMAGLKIQKEQADIELSKERTNALKKSAAAETSGGKGLKSAGAQVAAGMPLTQVVPGMSKAQRAEQQAVRREATNQIMEENPGMTETEAGIELAQRTIDYASTRAGRTQTARTVGATEANITMASSEARKMVAIVKDVASKMDLTEYPSINAVENAVSRGTGGTEIVRLNAALNGLTNTYARAINPKGTPTVEDKKEARLVINNAMSNGQTLAALSVMDQEMEASLASPEAARKVLDRVRTMGKKEETKPDVPHGAGNASVLDILKKHGVKK